MNRSAAVARKTSETDIAIRWCLDGQGTADVATGIPFFDHMLTLFAVHGFFDLTVAAKGDIAVDLHHTVEDVGLVMGDAINRALGDRKGIARYGYTATPMDDALAEVAVDLSNRPYMVYHVPLVSDDGGNFDSALAKEFFRALAVRGGMNLHINLRYGENGHHIIESVFKAAGRALNTATRFDPRIKGVRSSKGAL